jgi:hypothetical protein
MYVHLFSKPRHRAVRAGAAKVATSTNGFSAGSKPRGQQATPNRQREEHPDVSPESAQ